MPFRRLAARDANKYTKRARPITFSSRRRRPPPPPPRPRPPLRGLRRPFAVVLRCLCFQFTLCRRFHAVARGILLSHSVYTGITINPGVGEVDQHPRRTFNYQGTVAQEGKRQESFRRVRPASFESPRYRLAISLFPALSFSLLFYPLFLSAFVLLLSPRPYVIPSATGARRCLLRGRDREDQMIPIAHFPRFFF